MDALDGLPECPTCGSTLVSPGERYCVDHKENEEDKERQRYYKTLETKKKWRQKNERAWRRRWRLKSRALLMLALTYPVNSEERAELYELYLDAKKTANGQHRGTNRKAERKAAKDGVAVLSADGGSGLYAGDSGAIQQSAGTS